MEPAVHDNLGSLLRHVVIAHHDIRPLEADFSDTVLILVRDHDLHARQHMTDRVVAWVDILIQCRHRCALCQTVALQRHDTQIAEKL